MQKSGRTIFWSSSHFGPIRPPASSSKVKCSSTVPLQTFGDGLEREKREGVGGEVGLRDGNAAPVHHAIDHLGAERRMRPAFAGRDHVAMRVKRDHRPVPEAPADDEVGCRDHAGRAHEILGDDMALDCEARALRAALPATSAIGAQSPGGLEEGVWTSCARNACALVAAGSDVGQDPVLHDGGKAHAHSIGQRPTWRQAAPAHDGH